MARLIEEPAEFTMLLDQLRSELLIAVDTEAASFHRYHDRVYLLQVSTRRETWLIDPLAVPGLPGLDTVLGDPGIELVFHDADYDLRLLGHEFGYRAARLFDTSIAAQFLNEPSLGLAGLLEKYFAVRLDKRYQRADWSLRPLSAPMLEYAATDTEHLPALRDALRQQLIERGRAAWAEEECALLTDVRWPEPEPPRVQALAVKGARRLNPRALAVFRELYDWRERTAAALDRASFRIVPNETLFALASQPPRDLRNLGSFRGVGRHLMERWADEVLSATARGLSLPESELPRYPKPSRPRPDPAFERRLERLRETRSTLSQQFVLPPGVLCPNWLLERIARAAPPDLGALGKVDGIRRWQIREIGNELLATM